MLAFCISLSICIYLFLLVLTDIISAKASLERGANYNCKATAFIAFSICAGWTVYAWLLFQFPAN